MVPLLMNLIVLVNELRITSKGGVMNILIFQVRSWNLFADKVINVGNYWGITGEFIGNYYVITGRLLGNYWVINITCLWGIEGIVFELTLPFFITLYFYCFSLINKKEERDIKFQRWVIKGCGHICYQSFQLLHLIQVEYSLMRNPN